MKRHLIYLAAAALALSSCAHDAYETVDLDKYKEESTKSGFTVLRESDCNVLKDIPWSDYDKYYSDGGKTKATYTNLIGAVSGIVSSVTAGAIHQVVGTYTSTDIHGDAITVSGKIMYPKNGEIRNIMIVSHYTIGSNAECPSEGFSFEGIYAALGYAVVIADYIGFGVTRDEIHPYLQANTTANNVIDMALVARPFLKSRGIVPQSDEVILLGYSQGGATTLHVQRYMEMFYSDEFKIKKNYAGSGPYNIARTYDYAIKQDVTGIPCAIPMIIQGMSIGMDKPLEMSYFFEEPLRSHYQDWLNSKNYTVPQMSALIGSNKLSEILTPNACDKSKEETARFYRELVNNSIPSGFIPASPLYMFHSEDDETVPFINSQLMQRQFNKEGCSNVEYNFDHYGTHQSGALKFILTVAKILKEEGK